MRLADYLATLKELQGFLETGSDYNSVWEAAKGVLILLNDDEDMEEGADCVPPDLAERLALEISFAEWWISVAEPLRPKTIAAAERLAATLDFGLSTDSVDEEAVTVLGDERVKAGSIFLEWFEFHAPSFNVENGHIILAKRLGPGSVYHAWKSGDAGIRELVWEKVGRHWEWMSTREGGFIVAGRELVGIGHDKVGRILMQAAHLGCDAVALRLGLYGGVEMGAEVRDVIGVEPFGGRVHHEELELKLSGHTSNVRCLADLGGGRVVTGSQDATLRIWDIWSGSCAAVLKGHEKEVTCVAVLNHGKTLLSTSPDNTVRVWSLGAQDSSSPALRGECRQVITKSGILAMASVDPSRAVFSGLNGELSLWTASGADGSWSQGTKLCGHKEQARLGALVCWDGEFVASAGDSLVILVHSVATESIGKVLGELRGHADVITGLAVTRDGRLVSCSNDETVRVWSSSLSGAPEAILPSHEGYLLCVDVLPRDGSIVSGSSNGWLRVWSNSNDGNGDDDGKWRSSGVIKAHEGGVMSVKVLSESGGKQTVSAGWDHTSCVWDLSRGGAGKSKGHSFNLWCGAVLDDGRIASGGYRGRVVVWRKAERGKGAEVERVIEGAGRRVETMTRVKGGFAWWYDGTPLIHVWRDGAHVGGMEGIRGRVWSLKAVDEGMTLIGLDFRGLRVWDLKALKVVLHVKIGWGLCIDVVDNDHVVLGGWTGNVRVLNMRTGVFVTQLQIGIAPVWSLVYAGENRAVARSGESEMWSIDLGDCKTKQLDTEVSRVFVSLGNSQVLLQRRQGTVEVWDWKENELIVQLGGLVDDEVVNVDWDESRRLAVLFLRAEASWIAYEL